MTGIYEYWSLPEKLEIKCPCCVDKANFEFARIAKITLKKDVEYFQQHADFEYERLLACGILLSKSINSDLTNSRLT